MINKKLSLHIYVMWIIRSHIRSVTEMLDHADYMDSMILTVSNTGS